MHAAPLLLALLLALPASAATIVLDFEEEATGERGSSFVSVEDPRVTLYEDREPFPGILSVRPLFIGSSDLVLWPGEEGGRLRIEFSVAVSSVTVEFGDSGDQTVSFHPPTLVGYAGGAVVTSATTTPVMNGLPDEVLTIYGPLDAAVFEFVQLGQYEPETSPVLRIIFTVPEPGVATLLAAGALGLARARRRSPAGYRSAR